MRIVVTGGAGFIGANLCHRLRSTTDHEVVVVDDLSTGARSNLDGLDVDFHEGSILDAALLDVAFSGVHTIVHLAARGSVPKSVVDPVESHARNASGTMQVLEAARRAGNAHVIVASSSSVYGASTELPKHEGLVPRPISPYAASKLATESYALAYRHSYYMPVVAFRFFNVYGPRQPEGHVYSPVIPAFIGHAFRNEALPVNGDGEQSRDFTYVDTVADVLIDAAERAVSHPIPINLAYGSRVSLLDIADQLGSILERTLDRCHGPDRVSDVKHTQADPALLRSLFPEIEPVSFDDGLVATVEWWRGQSA